MAYSLLEVAVSPVAIVLWLIPAVAAVYWLGPYVTNGSLRSIPGPPLAAFSSIWLFYQARRGRRYEVVNDLHQKLGPLVRIQPHHVSVSDPNAINTIYGHGNGFLKSEFYEAFTNVQKGLFSTRDRAEHSRKRKIISHTFSQKSVVQFEQFIRQNLSELVTQWDRLSATGSGGYSPIDLMPWMNFLAFDVIGDLSFGTPFGMVRRGKDVAEIRLTPDAPITSAPAIEIFNSRSDLNAAFGCYPHLKPYAKYIPDPFFYNGARAVQRVAGLGHAQIADRLKNPDKVQRKDLLARLMEGRDPEGRPLSRGELTAEALTQLVAGSDTMSNSTCALLFHVIRTPGVLGKLQKELDAALPNSMDVPEYMDLKDLHYLHAVMKESMRVHSTNASGLPRVVPPGDGIEICGHHFPAGTVLSVPAWTVHHDKSVWGPDADEFRPERWESVTELQKTAFIPFSVGPRACTGRNLAEMQMALTVALIFRRYDFELYQNVLKVREGFLRKPLGCKAGIRKRTA